VSAKTRTDCSLKVTDLARPSGLIISVAFVTGPPEAVGDYVDVPSEILERRVRHDNPHFQVAHKPSVMVWPTDGDSNASLRDYGKGEQ
jgi:hypothetical protein